MKILLLEDDVVLSEIIIEHLESEHHHVTAIYDGIEAENLIFERKFDLLLLDVNVPLLSGFELLKELREKGNTTPAIFITSMNSSQNVSDGFSLGANDYLKKPFEMIELKARIKNIQRHFKIEDSSIISVSNSIQYDASRFILIVNKKERILSKKEGEFLFYLLQHRGEVVTTHELMVNVWSYDNAPTESTIRTYIKKLRKFISEGAISTVWGVGYIYEV